MIIAPRGQPCEKDGKDVRGRSYAFPAMANKTDKSAV